MSERVKRFNFMPDPSGAWVNEADHDAALKAAEERIRELEGQPCKDCCCARIALSDAQSDVEPTPPPASDEEFDQMTKEFRSAVQRCWGLQEGQEHCECGEVRQRLLSLHRARQGTVGVNRDDLAMRLARWRWSNGSVLEGVQYHDKPAPCDYAEADALLAAGRG